MNAPQIRYALPFAILVQLGTGIGVAPGWGTEFWLEQAYVKAANTGTGDQFGTSVAVSGGITVIGAPDERSAAIGVNGDDANDSAVGAGAAYVFSRQGANWVQEAYLKAPNPAANDHFGASVAVAGTTVVVGAPGEDSAATGVDGNGTDNGAEGAGAVYVYVRRDGIWILQAYLKASNTGVSDGLGTSVAISGDTVVVGAPQEASAAIGVNRDGTDNSSARSGAAYVFVRSGEVWTQQAYLKPTNTNPSDFFGTSVALSGDTVLVGAPGESSSSTEINRNFFNNSARDAGAAYVFIRRDGIWSQQAYLKATNTDAGDRFGASVAVWGNTAVVGAPGEAGGGNGKSASEEDDSAPFAGAVYVFARLGSEWSPQAYLKSSHARAYQSFGECVSVSGGQLAVGSRGTIGGGFDPFGGGTDTGNATPAASIFTRGDRWRESARLEAAQSEITDHFGATVALSGGTVVVGAPQEQSGATGMNGDRADNRAFRAGAAYVFTVHTSSVPAILAMTFEPQGLRLSLPPVFGQVIGVEYSPDLRSDSWIELGNFYPSENGMTFVDPDVVRTRRPSGNYRAFLRPKPTR